MALQPSMIRQSEETRAQAVSVLQPLVAEALDAYAAVKQAHWNTRGPAFQDVHELYDDIADIALGAYDTLAERIRALGGLPRGTLQASVVASKLPEMPVDVSAEPALQALVAERIAAWRGHIATARDVLERLDPEGFDDLVQLGKSLDKFGWFLIAHMPEAVAAVATEWPSDLNTQLKRQRAVLGR